MASHRAGPTRLGEPAVGCFEPTGAKSWILRSYSIQELTTEIDLCACGPAQIETTWDS
jgi:hypothetical protein